jgi:multiple RNA-binding domain-containing protein 1
LIFCNTQGTKDAPIIVKGHKRTREHTDDDGIKERKRQKIGVPSTTDETSKDEPKDPKKKGKKSQLEEFQAVMGAKRNGRPSWAAEVDLAPTGWPKKPEPSTTNTENASKKKDKLTRDKKKSEEVEEEQPDGMSDMEWMRRKMQGSSGALDDEKVFEQSDEEAEEEQGDVSAPNSLCPFDGSFCTDCTLHYQVHVIEATPSDPNHASILSNGRLFVRNLAFSCTEEELKQHFSTFGEIEQVRWFTPSTPPSSSKMSNI